MSSITAIKTYKIMGTPFQRCLAQPFSKVILEQPFSKVVKVVKVVVLQ